MPKPILHLLRVCALMISLAGPSLPGMAQITDTVFSGTPITPDPNLHSPFKDLNILRASADGHRENGTVEVSVVVSNLSYHIAKLLFSINPVLSKASDDLDSLYSISQLRYGSYKKEPGTNVTVSLRPSQMLHFGLFIDHVPENAQYIRKIVLLTSLTLDNVAQGQDNILLTDLKITWK